MIRSTSLPHTFLLCLAMALVAPLGAQSFLPPGFSPALPPGAKAPDEADWRLDRNYLVTMLPPEGIQAMRAPEWVSLAEDLASPTSLDLDGRPVRRPEDPCIVVDDRDGPRVYPLRTLLWHEVVNDTLDDGRSLVVSFCILTGSALVFEPPLNPADSKPLVFGVSGKLYQSNVVMYDEATGSLWPQLALGAYSGPLEGTRLSPRPFRISTLGIEAAQAGSRVLKGDSRLRFPQRHYGSYPMPAFADYGDTGEYRAPVDRRLAGEGPDTKEILAWIPGNDVLVPLARVQGGADPFPRQGWVSLYRFAARVFVPGSWWEAPPTQRGPFVPEKALYDPRL